MSTSQTSAAREPVPTSRERAAPEGGGSFFTWLAALVALVALVGSLYLSGIELKYGFIDLSFGLGLRACSFCLYQRALLMAIFALLAVGLVVRSTRPGLLAALALPAAIAGLTLSGQQAHLEMNGLLTCAPGIHDFGELGEFELGSIAQQSLAAFGLLAILLLLDLMFGGASLGIPVLAVLLGLMMAFLAMKSAPPPTPADADHGEMCWPRLP